MRFNFGQNKDLKWQETENLLRVLLSRLHMLLICADPSLDANIQKFIDALRNGQSIHDQHPLMKEIASRINKLKGTALIAANAPKAGREGNKKGRGLVFDVFMALLSNINFPSHYRERVDEIKIGLTNDQNTDDDLKLVAAITALSTILDDIFERVDSDKKKLDSFLKQVDDDLKSMDKGIGESNRLNSQKQALEASIDIKVTTEVHEMENMLTSQAGGEVVKKNVMASLQQIRSHMTVFKAQEWERTQRAMAVTNDLQDKLDNMEKECTYLRQQVLERQQQVLSDPVTGIRNRLAYDEAIQMECDRFIRYGRPFTLVVLGMDHFKQVNEDYGQGTGDKALQIIARVLVNNARNVDFVARYGEEKFVVIFPELGVKDARMVAEKACKAVAAQKIDIGGNNIGVTVSAGAARVHDGDTPRSLFERANNALRLAGDRGHNRVEIE